MKFNFGKIMGKIFDYIVQDVKDVFSGKKECCAKKPDRVIFFIAMVVMVHFGGVFFMNGSHWSNWVIASPWWICAAYLAYHSFFKHLKED